MSASTADAACVTAPARTGTIAASHALVDCLFLAVVTGVSMVTYVGALGFYYDDYSVLYRMAFSSDQSLVGLYDSVRPATGQRPLQALIFATLYRLFGWIHSATTSSTRACSSRSQCLYLVMRELRLPRLLCVGIPLVYSILPHYATNRFWVNAFPDPTWWPLLPPQPLRGVASAAGSADTARRMVGRVRLRCGQPLCVRGHLPLFALNVGLVWWAARQLREKKRSRRLGSHRGRRSGGGDPRRGDREARPRCRARAERLRSRFQDGFLHHIAYLVSGGIKLNLGTYFVAVPYVLWWIVRHAFGVADAAAAAAAGLLAFGYVWWIGQRIRVRLPAVVTGAIPWE